MSARKRNMLRVGIMIAGLVLALIVAGPVLAQEGGDTPTPDENAPIDETLPSDLDDIAVRLMPLLVGAALIERTLEFLFNWVERAIIDAGHVLNRLAARLSGLLSVDIRKVSDDVAELAGVMLAQQAADQAPMVGDADSADPHDWPLAVLEDRLFDARQKLVVAQAAMENAMSSPVYISRKKMVAGWLGIVLGILLAIVGDLRLLQPLGVEAADWFEGAYGAFDLLLAGVLMGLGTEWVHQVIGLLIKGKGALGRAGGKQVDPEELRALTQEIIQAEFQAQAQRLREDLEHEVSEIRRPDSPPN